MSALRDAIAGERRHWHVVEVRPDDIAALLDAAYEAARTLCGEYDAFPFNEPHECAAADLRAAMGDDR
jgi:hypothetical protein